MAKKNKESIRKKIRKLLKEGKSKDQAVKIALEMAKERKNS